MFEWLAVMGLVNRRKGPILVHVDRRKHMSRKEAADHLKGSIERLEETVSKALGKDRDA